VRDPQSADAPPLRVDFIKDIATQFGDRRDFGGVRVDIRATSALTRYARF